MPHPCVVCGRSRMNPNNREEEYMFFGFPVNNDERCKKWLEFCGREDLYKLTKKQLLQRMVCSKHFEVKDFLNEYFDRLNCTAVPSIYDPKQSLYNITCVLCGRFREDPPSPDYDGTTFHHFPGEEFRCLKWLDFVGVDSYYRLTRKEILFCYICSHHFDKSQFMYGYRNRLVDNAIPNIRFPEEMNGSEQFIMEVLPDIKQLNCDKPKKLDPLPPEVLDSQACAACGRSRSDPSNRIEKYKFHPFPAYEIGRCLRWCQFLGREDLLKMSPNQIRKLVLCSKHFLSGQSFQKIGSCDAVPTIKDITDSMSINVPTVSPEIIDHNEIIKEELEEVELHSINDKRKKFKNEGLPLVSSKKPFVVDKPTPLAKKRGKSKRPTSITIPRPHIIDIDNRILRKLPLPPASRNCDIWKLQPITIANNLTPITNVNTTDVKKVILPFTGNISDLGKPIPVSSLSSIPPGLLIKIDLPEASTVSVDKTKQSRKQNHTAAVNSQIQLQMDQPKRRGRRRTKNQINQNINIQNTNDMAELLNIQENNLEMQELINEEAMNRDIVIEKIDNIEQHNDQTYEESNDDAQINFQMSEELNMPKSALNNLLICHESAQASSSNDISNKIIQRRIRKPKCVMSARAKRTLLPITSEINYFLKKLKPQMRRLPKKARAQLKLSIVTMVIDYL
ncbi:hypothetical protein PV325_006537 [Microctonus aethiopoides]|uniref:THAP-type domain-containing protein n=1 Tax=Microctonus aethiopoides TaxID=144406 RepID=A0AA39KKW2_9HYME|nr:hypothetical protein PV325_006537 [Microctonus aethiopoides]KAK0099181.1 hypothetical protein PV326_000018 [Microctonus aethiopoides]KAK0165204.1 hypothetical protein PV328_003741 [Microctonus aethiopoides]